MNVWVTEKEEALHSRFKSPANRDKNESYMDISTVTNTLVLSFTPAWFTEGAFN
jgi:hypothetical protein